MINKIRRKIMRKQIRKAMICTIAMMLVAIVTLTGVTYAWFSQSDTAVVSGADVTLKSVAGGVKMSLQPNPAGSG
jgi:1,4-dihydroxy-2-naphthoate octaprenyltransferase